MCFSPVVQVKSCLTVVSPSLTGPLTELGSAAEGANAASSPDCGGGTGAGDPGLPLEADAGAVVGALGGAALLERSNRA